MVLNSILGNKHSGHLKAKNYFKEELFTHW